MREEKLYTFLITMPSEPAAGIIGFTDTVRIIVDSSASFGDEEEFGSYIKGSLAEWYDGAFVEQLT